ncbi:hypothetical protein BU16DRAFT_538425 [Lophium mytilinum]|uniref:Mid2 domain-containing protein n=1 Tax=Lophium mytilinum TaxID=390894 RepID=A0A6A6QV57_9PEZI|nr:hypothetical protein BU16DRAFT_538425 [Lophium mytilinum]
MESPEHLTTITAIVDTTSTTVTLTAHGTSYQLLAANVASLTSVFTPPASCATPCFFPNDQNRSDVALINTACSYSGNDHRECEPGSYNSSATVFPYYSPGLCPHGYTAACSPISELYFAPNITAQVCCPTGFQCNHYDYQGDYSAQCFSYVPVSSSITPIFLFPNISATGQQPVYYSFTASPVTYIATVAYAGITVAWEATDTAIVKLLASSSSALSVSLAAANSSNTAPSSSLTSTQQPTSSQPSASHSPNGGLSAGAKAGIGIGAVIVVALIAGGVYLYIRRLKKALQAARDGPEQAKSELPATEKKRPEPVEMDVTPHVIHELAVNEIPVEIDGQYVEEGRRS